MLPLLAGLVSSGIGKLFGTVAGKACDIVSEFVEDKDLAAQINAKLSAQIIATDTSKFIAEIEAQRSVLVAEIQGESWMQRNWRPMVMLMFAAIIANNYIVFPYLSMFEMTAGKVTQLELSPMMWQCLKLGLSGYIVGRSMEKIAAGSGIAGVLGKMKNGSK